MATSTADDDVIIESSSSGPGTPLVSNPGTPRSAAMDASEVNVARQHFRHIKS